MLDTNLVTVKELLCKYAGPQEQISAAVDEVFDQLIKDERVREALKNGTIKVRECDFMNETDIENLEAGKITVEALAGTTLSGIVEKFNEAWEEEQRQKP